MNKTKQRIAIAELCGFKWWTFDFRDYYPDERCQLLNFVPASHNWKKDEQFKGYRRKSDNKEAYYEQFEFVPDYLNDLNAIQEAVEKYIPKNLRVVYWRELLNAVTPIDYSPMPGCDAQTWAFINAKPKHRAMAFLKTLGKWTD